MVKFDDLVLISDSSHEHNETYYFSSWVVDFEASFHATPHRRSFIIYKGGNFSVVKMKNYKKSKVIDVSDVKVMTI